MKTLKTALAALLLSSTPLMAEELIMSSWLPPKHPIVVNAFEPWAEEVEKVTDGRVTVRIMRKPLGSPPAHFDMARDGIADVTYGLHSFTEDDRFNRARLGQFSFLGDDAIANSKAYWSIYGGELDAAVMVTTNMRDRMALQTEIIDTSPYQLWLPNGHELSTRTSVSIEDLVDEPIIMLRVDEIEEATRRLLSAFGARPRVAFRTRSVEAVRSLVATGAGIAILPELVYRRWSLEGDRIVSRDVSGSLPVVQVGVVWRKGAPLSPATREFIRSAQTYKNVR
ncbi:hypothetical protein HC022_05450 [Salipiger sp. HF18]|uniref:LysR substrate-binding domain-containing protein n=1 Tax=Salipiger sp. HF18 TaxID=2721557 RepID=UPI00142D7BAB|nr:LysR substrate-binding domain-containing protein [Salipiger sp. HF18]NIY95715.1 hypothetical protein [Salipiger sp. HF18]